MANTSNRSPLPSSSEKSALPVARVIWAAMAFTLALFGVMITLIQGAQKGEVTPLLSLTTAILIAVIFAVLSMILPEQIAPARPKPDHPVAKEVTTNDSSTLLRLILGLVLAEGVAITGFVYAMAETGLQGYLPFAAFALVLYLARFPR